MNGKIKKSNSTSRGGATYFFFLPFPRQSHGNVGWQCLLCPLPTPAAPLIYHRPGPLTKRIPDSRLVLSSDDGDLAVALTDQLTQVYVSHVGGSKQLM